MLIYYHDFFGPGGFPRETTLLADALVEQLGPDDRIVVVGAGGDRLARRGSDGRLQEINLAPGRKGPLRHAGLRRAARVFRDAQPDVAVLIDNGIPASAWAASALVRQGVPYVLSLGDVMNPFLASGLRGRVKRLYFKTVLRRMARDAHRLHLFSRSHVDEVLPWVGSAARKKVFISTFGIDWEAVPGSRVAPPVSLRVGFLGRLDAFTKGLDLLVDGWRQFRGEGGEGVLYLAGPATDRWRAFSATFDATLGIKVLPPVDLAHKVAFFSTVSVFAHPSRHEGVPRVIREAIAYGVPVLVTKQTNLADVVEATGCGWICETTPTSIAQQLHALAADPSCVDAAASRCSLAADDVLSWPVVAAQFADELTHINATGAAAR